MKHNTSLPKHIIAQDRGEVKPQKPEVKVIIHLPDSVSANSRRQKINRIYELLSGVPE